MRVVAGVAVHAVGHGHVSQWGRYDLRDLVSYVTSGGESDLVEYLTTTDGLTVIAIASSTMPGGYLEGIYHRAKLIVFLIRSSDINHKIELLRGLMTIHTVAEHRPTFLFAFSTAAASHKHEFLQVADSLRVSYTEITVPLADSATLWRTIQERLAATVLPLHANRMRHRGAEPDTRSSAESGPAISPSPATPIGSPASRSAAATPALPPPSAAVAPAISAAVPAANSFVSQPVTKGDFDMANVAESLKAILSIDGAMGCALVVCVCTGTDVHRATGRGCDATAQPGTRGKRWHVSRGQTKQRRFGAGAVLLWFVPWVWPCWRRWQVRPTPLRRPPPVRWRPVPLAVIC